MKIFRVSWLTVPVAILGVVALLLTSCATDKRQDSPVTVNVDGGTTSPKVEVSEGDDVLEPSTVVPSAPEVPAPASMNDMSEDDESELFEMLLGLMFLGALADGDDRSSGAVFGGEDWFDDVEPSTGWDDDDYSVVEPEPWDGAVGCDDEYMDLDKLHGIPDDVEMPMNETSEMAPGSVVFHGDNNSYYNEGAGSSETVIFYGNNNHYSRTEPSSIVVDPYGHVQVDPPEMFDAPPPPPPMDDFIWEDGGYWMELPDGSGDIIWCSVLPGDFAASGCPPAPPMPEWMDSGTTATFDPAPDDVEANW